MVGICPCFDRPRGGEFPACARRIGGACYPAPHNPRLSAAAAQLAGLSSSAGGAFGTACGAASRMVIWKIGVAASELSAGSSG